MKTVIEMAREAGLRSAVLLHMYRTENALCDTEIEELRQIERLAELVRADEREACAKVCGPQEEHDDPLTAWKIATAIRARGQA